MSGILSFDDLRRISRLGSRASIARVERWMQQQGISFKYDGRGGLWTTQEALNAALGIGAVATDTYSPSVI